MGRGHVSTPFGFKASVVRETPASYKPQSTPCLRENQTSTAVDRLKLVKRQMYGHASFDLLRRRVLLAA